jgi:uncharacterized protein DUF4304
VALDGRSSGGASPSPGELIDAVIASGPAALLKAAGFRKRGRKFYLVESESSAHLDFRGSRSNSRELTRFTIDLGRYFPALARHLGKEVIQDAGKRTWCHHATRITHVMGVEPDYWWELSSPFEASRVGASVTAALRDRAIPFLRSIATLEGLVAKNPMLPQWLHEHPREERAAAFSILGREDEARAVRAQLRELERPGRDPRGIP